MRRSGRRLVAFVLVVVVSLVIGQTPAMAAPVPVLQSTTPANGASVNTQVVVKATYDVELNTSTSTLGVKDKDGTNVLGQVTFTNSNKTIEFKLSPGSFFTEAA
ncbi:MAG: Ig-like domain-containing protein, partial [Acidimicrobiales bacterium]